MPGGSIIEDVGIFLGLWSVLSRWVLVGVECGDSDIYTLIQTEDMCGILLDLRKGNAIVRHRRTEKWDWKGKSIILK